VRDEEILYCIVTPIWPWTRFTLLLTISFMFFLECQDQVSLEALAFNVLHSNPLKIYGAKVGQGDVEGVLI